MPSLSILAGTLGGLKKSINKGRAEGRDLQASEANIVGQMEKAPGIKGAKEDMIDEGSEIFE